MKQDADRQKTIADWVKNQIVVNACLIKYGIVGCAGIVVNLGTMALFFRVSSQRGWEPSAVANIVSTVGNFAFHNVWTFSDRQHQGARLVRGFLYFALMSAVGISISTASYVGLARMAAHMTIANSHSYGMGILLACQFFAILLGASISYILNREFTWPRTPENAPADSTQAQVI